MQAKNTLPVSNEATQSIHVDNNDDTVNTSPSFNNANTQPDLKSLRQHEITHLGDEKGIFRRSNEKSSQNKSELRTPRKLPSIKYQKQSP